METATPGKFDLFQAKVFPVIEYLTTKPENANHAFTKRWTILKRTPNTPMKVDITWSNLKILLGIKTMFEYRDFLTQCPEFSSVVKLQNSRTTKSGFDFGIYSSYTDMLSSLTSSQEQSTSKSSLEDELYVIEINTNSPEPSLQAETIMTPHEQLIQSGRKSVEVATISGADPTISDSKTDISNTPRQSNLTVTKEATPNDITQIEDTDGSITTDELAETGDLIQDIPWVNIEETTGFNQVHYCLFNTVNTWAIQETGKNNPFYRKWQKAIYAGLTALTQ
jgi:hypothetical protein